MNRVEALIRIRPLSIEEKNKGIQQAWHKIGSKGVIQHLNHYGQEVSAQTLLFDWVFGEDSKNEDIFTYLNSTIDEALHNVNVCIIAYGQTSSGKTHTMKGVYQNMQSQNIQPVSRWNNDPGVILRSFDWLFSKKTTHKFSLSYVEVYNENIYDLLGDPSESLQIRESAEGEIYIKDVSEIEVYTKELACSLFTKGNTIRKVSTTRMNRESSRSHAVLKISVKNKGEKRSLVFVDLAGSERVSTAKTSGATLKEGACINKSLLALTSVISKLSNKQSHIPYRNAKLTRILQPSLSGPAKTVIICAVSPVLSCIDETISTLSLASRARNIEIKPMQKPKVRKEDANREILKTKKSNILINKITEDVKKAKNTVYEMQIAFKQVESAAEKILKDLRQVFIRSQNKENRENKAELLDGILKELKTSKTEHIERLYELSETVSFLVNREKVLSENIKPPAEVSILLEHLAEGDAMLQKQKEEIQMLYKMKHIDDANISLAMEMDRIKKSHQREKRILQLEIAQLKSQLKFQNQKSP